MKNFRQANYFIANRNRREWAALPSSFELDAVRAAFNDMKPYFDRCEIADRIAASRATTFAELLDAIDPKYGFHADDREITPNDPQAPKTAIAGPSCDEVKS